MFASLAKSETEGSFTRISCGDKGTKGARVKTDPTERNIHIFTSSLGDQVNQVTLASYSSHFTVRLQLGDLLAFLVESAVADTRHAAPAPDESVPSSKVQLHTRKDHGPMWLTERCCCCLFGEGGGST